MVTETRTLPAEFIEALGKTYADTLTKTIGTPITTTDVSGQLVKGELDADRIAQGLKPETDAEFEARKAGAKQTAREFDIRKAQMADLAPTVAGMDQLQRDAITKATGATGLGAYQQYLTDAATAAGQAGTTLGGVAGDISAARTGLGAAGTTLGQVDPFITAAGTGLAGAGTTLGQAQALTGTGAGTGAGTIASYMSPYQQQVIDTTMAEFDRQAAIRANQQAAAALGTPGAFGGGREGVQRAEYQAASDRNRAATFANLQQQGFQNAAARRQQDLANQMGISNLQSGLGARAQDFSRAQISGLGTLGAAQQAQNQAVLDAQRQAAQMAIDEPRQALARFGQGIAGITPGAGSIRIGEAPAAAGASPLMKALGLGLAGADIYGRIFT